MNLKELIASTNNVRGRGQAKVFQKKFGSIYAYNKNVSVAKNGKAIVYVLDANKEQYDGLYTIGNKCNP